MKNEKRLPRLAGSLLLGNKRVNKQEERGGGGGDVGNLALHGGGGGGGGSCHHYCLPVCMHAVVNMHNVFKYYPADRSID